MTSLDFNTPEGRADIAKTVEACKVRGLIKFPVQSSSMAEQRPVKASVAGSSAAPGAIAEKPNGATEVPL